LVDVKVARLDIASGTLSGAAVNASLRFPGRNTAPAWSPDGKRLAYLTRRGSENYGQDSRFITVLSVDTGEEREVNPRLAHMERLVWSPDGKSLLVSGADRRSRGGLFRVDAESAEMETLVLDDSAGFRGPEAAWAADGKAVYFVRGEGSQGSSLVRHEIESREERVLYRAESERIGQLRSSPGGRWLAFTQRDSEGGDSTLYAFDTEDKKLRRFLSLPGESVDSLSWQPVGEKILVGVTQQGHPELWQIPIEGGDAVKLRLPDGWNADVYPHPDGERVGFTTGRDFAEVWVIENLAAALPKVP
jgi:Tol biopolymer transport system component